MKIGVMCHSSIGGSTRVATELASELARRGHRVHLFTRTTPFGCWDQASGVVLHRIVPDDESIIPPAKLYTDWPLSELQAFLSRLLQVITDEGLDLLHFHYAVPFAFLAGEVKRELRGAAPVVIGTLHGTDVSIHGRDPIKGAHLAATLLNLDALTTVSRSHAHLSKEVFGLSALPKVIPNFVDLSKFRPRHRARLSMPRIVHVSNFRPVKDPQSAARIFLGIREKMDAELWLVGDGQEMDEIKFIFKHNAFGNDVHFLGLRWDVPSILAQADLLLVTSLHESFCLAALEAMACGVPVLATNVGGLPEIVVHGKSGLLFPANDHASAVALAAGLLSDPARHRNMANTALAHASRFAQDHIVSAYELMYEGLLCAADRMPRSCLS